MELLISQSINGLSVSAMLFITALGLVIIFGLMDVVNMAHNAIAKIENKRAVTVRETLKECMEEKCVHRVPLLGIPYYRHKRYPNTDIAMQFAPEIQHAKTGGWGDMMVCEGLKEMALWLMHESGYPEELQVMNLSLNDFQSLK